MKWLKKVGKFAMNALPVVGDYLDYRAARKESKANIALQKEFAQHGVQWRVEDAKAAGIHPLAALGMQGMQFSPVYSQSGAGEALSSAGQAIGRAVGGTAHDKAMQNLALAAAQKSLEESDARIGALRSEEARNYREANAAQTFPVPDPFWDQFGVSAGVADKIVSESVVPSSTIDPVSPAVVAHTAGDVSTMAGATPLWRQFTVADGVRLALPGGVQGDAAEVLESLAQSPALLSLVIAHNKRVNPNAAAWLQEVYFGNRSSDDPWWRKPGAWLGGKLADLRDQAAARSYEERRRNQIRR